METTKQEAVQIVVVDDDAEMRTSLTEYLSGHGLATEAVSSGTALWALLQDRPSEVVMLELQIPNEDSLSILRTLSGIVGGPSVIMFSESACDIDRVVALEIGADDFVAKHANPREILARVRSVIRRRRAAHAETGNAAAAERQEPAHGRLAFGEWIIDCTARRLVSPGGKVVPLSAVEFDILLTFARSPHTIVSRSKIAAIAGDPAGDRLERSMDVKISRLRAKLAAGSDDEIIRTVRGRGYLFVQDIIRS